MHDTKSHKEVKQNVESDFTFIVDGPIPRIVEFPLNLTRYGDPVYGPHAWEVTTWRHDDSFDLWTLTMPSRDGMTQTIEAAKIAGGYVLMQFEDEVGNQAWMRVLDLDELIDRLEELRDLLDTGE